MHGFIIIPSVVGHTPRTVDDLRNVLGGGSSTWALIHPYTRVTKSLCYPLSLVIPFPGLKKRVDAFIKEIDWNDVVTDIIVKAKFMRENGCDRITLVSWSLGTWFALKALEHESASELFDDVIGISPIMVWPSDTKVMPNEGKISPKAAIETRILLIMSEKDPKISSTYGELETWASVRGDTFQYVYLKGAKHAFDQQWLRHSSVMPNPEFNSIFTQTADATIRAFLRR